VRFHLGSFIVGIAVYWAFQHFTPWGNTGNKG
jgi:hypothetical protein